MQQVNEVHLIGRLGQATLSCVPGGHSYYRLTVATNFVYRSSDDCPVIETTWHDVLASPSDINGLEDAEKGYCVEVFGRIRNQRYTDAYGNEKFVSQIYASKVKITKEKL